MTKRTPAPAKRQAGAALDIPTERPAASGELVEIRDLPDYRRRHGLRIVRAFWPTTERYPRLIVEDMDPNRGKEHS